MSDHNKKSTILRVVRVNVDEMIIKKARTYTKQIMHIICKTFLKPNENLKIFMYKNYKYDKTTAAKKGTTIVIKNSI